MGKLGGIVLLATLALSGCASAPSVGEPAAEVEQVPDPADPSTYNSSYSADEFFIAGVKLGWVGERPSNSELVRAGMEACEKRTAPSDSNSQRILDYASAVYC